MDETPPDTLILPFDEEQPSTSAPLSDSDCSDSSSSLSDGAPTRAPRRFVSKLDANLKGLMGEANLRYARGDTETAQKMCFEVMRQVPDAYEPYLTLAQIFENSDPTKYEGYLAIASCLYPHDSGVWCRLAELNIQNGKYKEAVSYYSRAIRASPRNMGLHLKRLELVEQIGDVRFALACKKHMANKLPRAQHQNIIELCKEVAKHYHEERNYAKALEVLKIPFKRIPKRVTQDLVNMMLELLLLTERFTECLDIFIQHCNFTFEITVNENNKIVIDSYVMPPSIQIDLKVKFIVCLIKLKSFHLVPPLIDSMIREENVEEIGDLYLDVAEDLMATDLSTEALKLLVPLVKSTTYNLAAVWLKYAECLYNCDMLEQAVEAYFTVMTMAPQHVEVLYPLAMTLLKLNKKSEALEVLSQDLSTNKLDVAVLIERMKLLRQIDDIEEYWKCAELLLSRHCVAVKYPEEARVVITTSHTVNEKVRKIRDLRRFRGDSMPVESGFESIREPSVQAEFEVYKGVLRFALERREYAQLQKFAFMGLTSKRLTEYAKIQLFALFSAIYNNDTFHGYNLIRNVVLNDRHNTLAWNLFNIVLKSTDDVRHNRFISRLQERVPDIDCLQAIEANYSLTTNSNLAIKFYMREFRKHKLPYFALILGVILLQGYSKRKTVEDRKKLAEIASYLFIFYAKNRSGDAQQEIYYNLGRMYHQLGVMYLAENYYLKVLEIEEKPPCEVLGLRHEAAFNLHLIYKNSGNFIAARNVLMKHITI
ncbi:general transcription factor 3C polypeptide 3 isoform X2 [Tribolium madens]|uniref:general transcription factor 3C polypeptide 3 isoform X2 n=1 Tax=Tribolium madens TaxID=41895 RepID=UPI001CF72165|nr:general transcription factor 3C polypeptide 3 isoform X2 [Tribolium madens]